MRRPSEEGLRDFKVEVRRFMADNFFVGSPELGDDVSFLARGILDSTGVLELIAFLEKTYGVEVKDDEIVPENLDSLDAIQAYLGRKVGA